jgi:hypothetical protein
MTIVGQACTENAKSQIQGDQKVSVHLMITVKKQKYFKRFQSLTMIT